MTTTRMKDWDAGDFGRYFRQAARESNVAEFSEKLGALGAAIEPLDREFIRETASCGRDLSSTLEDLHSIAARVGYCERDRGFEKDCGALYADVDRVIGEIEGLRGTCFK